jgi:recombination protein RecT
MSPWNDKDQFHAMAKKTVLKNMISKWGIMSIEMQTAHLADQSIQEQEGKYDYADNSTVIDVEAENVSEEEKRVKLFIDKAETMEQLEQLKESVPQQLMFYYDARVDELNIA